jgi:hypothetical protein
LRTGWLQIGGLILHVIVNRVCNIIFVIHIINIIVIITSLLRFRVSLRGCYVELDLWFRLRLLGVFRAAVNVRVGKGVGLI